MIINQTQVKMPITTVRKPNEAEILIQKFIIGIQMTSRVHRWFIMAMKLVVGRRWSRLPKADDMAGIRNIKRKSHPFNNTRPADESKL